MTDEDIQRELARIKERNIAAELATAKVRARTRRENMAVRLRVEQVDKERLRREFENSQHHLKAFANMYDNSPYRYDIVEMRRRQREKREKEEADHAKFQATMQTLADMTGIVENHPARLTTRDNYNKVVNSPLKHEIVRHRLTFEDNNKVKDELRYLHEYVAEGLQETKKTFKCFQENLDTTLQGHSPDRLPSLVETLGSPYDMTKELRPDVSVETLPEFSQLTRVFEKIPSLSLSTLTPKETPADRMARLGKLAEQSADRTEVSINLDNEKYTLSKIEEMIP